MTNFLQDLLKFLFFDKIRNNVDYCFMNIWLFKLLL